jgi:hypothetical protein
MSKWEWALLALKTAWVIGWLFILQHFVIKYW